MLHAARICSHPRCSASALAMGTLDWVPSESKRCRYVPHSWSSAPTTNGRPSAVPGLHLWRNVAPVNDGPPRSHGMALAKQTNCVPGQTCACTDSQPLAEKPTLGHEEGLIHRSTRWLRLGAFPQFRRGRACFLDESAKCRWNCKIRNCLPLLCKKAKLRPSAHRRPVKVNVQSDCRERNLNLEDSQVGRGGPVSAKICPIDRNMVDSDPKRSASGWKTCAVSVEFFSKSLCRQVFAPKAWKPTAERSSRISANTPGPCTVRPTLARDRAGYVLGTNAARCRFGNA